MPLSEQYLHESACGLAEDDHYVADSFIDVLDTVVDEAPIALDMGAAGCGGCFHIDEDEYDGAVFWVAQGDSSEQLAVKYDTVSDELTRTELGELICHFAEQHSVTYSWSGSARDTVMLGVEGYYTTYDLGTRVKSKRTGAHGTVLSPELIYEREMNVGVWDQADFDGHGRGGDKLAMFEDRSDAERFVRNHSRERRDDLEVMHAHQSGTSDGDNIVLFDGRTKAMIMKGSDLVVLDD